MLLEKITCKSKENTTLCFGLLVVLRIYVALALYIASMLYVASLHNHAIVASGMYHIVFIKTENIVGDEIGSIICSHLLAHSHTYF